jgi:hypothetical protein
VKIYFGGSIRGGRRDKAIYHALVKHLCQYGRVLTEHVADQRLTARGETTDTGELVDSRHIYERDTAWLRDADVAVMEVSTPSLGVGYEIARAEHQGIPILCLYCSAPRRTLSAMIAGNPHLVLRKYRSVGEVKAILEQFFGSFAYEVVRDAQSYR